MKKISLDLILIVLGICTIGIIVGYFFLATHGEGDPYFVFIEVPVNYTINSSIIHLEDKDIVNIRGLDVKQTNGKITRIYFRQSNGIPEISSKEFYDKYGSSLSDPSSRKYLEYKGVYYYALELIP
jgi:hypothetical protein